MTPRDRAFIAAHREQLESWRSGAVEMPGFIPADSFLRLLDIVDRLDRELDEDVMSEFSGTPLPDQRSPRIWVEGDSGNVAASERSPFAFLLVTDGDEKQSPRVVEVDREIWERRVKDTGYPAPAEVLADC